ncbi:MarR family transcriptional regulator, partial [Acinetobacter bohemicus]|nr:MarR family transcriptional regulator [Acinetobacter bohemicus]
MTVDKKDSRVKKNTLTSAGLIMYEKMYQVAKEREEKILEVLSDEDQEHLIRILNILNCEINDINEFFIEKYIQK